MLCVTNTPIAIKVAYKIIKYLNNKMLVIDLTTHNKKGATQMDKIFKTKKISYNFCGVMGGPCASRNKLALAEFMEGLKKIF